MNILHFTPTRPSRIFYSFIITFPALGLDIASFIASCSLRSFATFLPVDPKPNGFNVFPPLPTTPPTTLPPTFNITPPANDPAEVVTNSLVKFSST
ncbi:hypothetical protein C4S77_04425 [Apibacter adventoris]|uniref:Uncharacterized protein n=1 Tax=Apibacter adventoris TaxID=1679466 RepID=A0A2S8AEY0_9FLAO|nr:hypothetical protein C4S77_04425 [Apibacter adventoris]